MVELEERNSFFYLPLTVNRLDPVLFLTPQIFFLDMEGLICEGFLSGFGNGGLSCVEVEICN